MGLCVERKEATYPITPDQELEAIEKKFRELPDLLSAQHSVPSAIGEDLALQCSLRAKDVQEMLSMADLREHYGDSYGVFLEEEGTTYEYKTETEVSTLNVTITGGVTGGCVPSGEFKKTQPYSFTVYSRVPWEK